MLNNQPAGNLWHLKDTDADSQYYGRTFHFDFSYIHSEEMKSVVKDYVWQNWKTGNKSLIGLYQDISRNRHFAEFAAQHRIDSFRELDNSKVDLFLSYLRTVISSLTKKPLSYVRQKDCLDMLEAEMVRLKELGYERQWQVEYVKYKYLKPLVEELEVQLHEESA